MKKITFISMMLLVINLSAVTTQYKEQKSYFDFLSGYMDNISLDENGQLTLAPYYRSILETEENYIWNIVEDSKGNIYCGSGNNGFIYKIANSKSKLFFDSMAQEVTALTIDKKNNIYAALSPKGIIYKITPSGNASIFATLKSTYIWSMLFDSHNNLFVATGNDAGIYKFTSNGEQELFFTTPTETHFITMVIDDQDNLFTAGSEDGLVYKIKPDKSASVLFDTQGMEITAIIIDHNNNLFVNANYKLKENSVKPLLDFTKNKTQQKKDNLRQQKISQNSFVYKIFPNGNYLKLIDLPKIFFLSLAVDTDNNVYIGSGNNGDIYKITPNEVVSRLCSLNEEQVLALSISKNGQLLASTGNMGNLYKIQPNYSSRGEFTSKVFDTIYNSKFGSFAWTASIPKSTSISIFTRSGNSSLPDEFWSDWEKCSEKILSPAHRFFQYKLIFSSSNKTKTPVLSSIKFSYKPNNQQPYIDSISMEFPDPPKLNNKEKSKYKASLNVNERKLKWIASDPDKDELEYTIYFQNKNSKYWKVLKAHITKESYIFNSTLLPDGQYFFKITASDLPSNTKSDYKTFSRKSKLLLIDNTPPEIKNIKTTTQNDKLLMSGIAIDKLSDIASISYSFNTSKWIQIMPDDNIFDSKTEKLSITIPIPKKTDFLIIKVTDKNNNIHTEKIIF